MKADIVILSSMNDVVAKKGSRPAYEINDIPVNYVNAAQEIKTFSYKFEALTYLSDLDMETCGEWKDSMNLLTGL